MKNKNRPMRILLLFDLPSTETEEKKEYTKFKKALFKNGYYMLQYSVYVKTINVQTKINNEVNKLKPFIPLNGSIRVIAITENQYQTMNILLGKKNFNEIYNSTERYLKI